MRFVDILKLSLRMFKARTMRTLLTIFGMSIGIAAILFLVSFGYGLQKTLLERITTADSLVTIDVGATDNLSPVLDETLRQSLASIPGVVDAIPVVTLSGQGSFDGLTLDTEITASQTSFLKLAGKKLLAGTFPSNETSAHSLIITSSVATVFNKTPEAMLGKSLTLKIFRQQANKNDARQESFSDEYTIIGVVSDDKSAVYIPLSSVLAGTYTHFSQIKLKCASTSEMPAIRTLVLDRHLFASSISETVDQANRVFSIIQLVLMLFGIIALVVSAIGMFNTMTIALLERTEEIGIMKSIGASKVSISLMFIFESTLMGFLGGAFGVLFGLLGGLIANVIINLVATRFGGEAVTLFYSPWWFILAIVVFGSFVGFLTGLFPATKASRIDPLDALRYK